MTVLSASYAATASFALNAGGGGSSIGSYTSLIVTEASSTWSFEHNTGQRYPIFQVFDNNGFVIIPSQIQTIDDNNANIIFPSPQTGRVIASLGGGNGTTQEFSSSSLWVVDHDLGTDYPDVTIWDSNRNIIFPNRIESVNTNQIKVYFSVPVSGHVSVSRGGHIISGSVELAWGSITNKPAGLVSGSEQLTGSYDTRYVLSGSITQTTWDNIGNKPNGIVSSSVQVDITGTTGYPTFSGSISSSIGQLSSSIATTDLNQNNRLGSLETESGSIRSNFNSFTSSYTTGAFTGSFIGDGIGLYNIPASGVTGLNLNKIISGSVSASISPDRGLEINTNVYIDGSLTAKELFINYISSSVLYQSGSTNFGDTSDDNHSFTGSVLIDGGLSADSITGSINFNNLTNVPTLVSGSSQIFTGYDYEIHVSQVDGNDTTGNGDLLTPVASITKALTLTTSSRKTIIVHPGTYSENITVGATNTTIATSELTGANTLLSGTLTIGTSGSSTRISGLKMTNLVISGTAQAYISNCTIDDQVTKSSSGYVEIINSEMQCTSGIQISGAGTTIINGNKNVGIAVSNASAQVIIKGCNSVVTPSASAGNLAIVDCIVTALGGNGITITGASTTLTLANSQVLVQAGNNVAPISVAGIYSIINTIYDKPGSTLTGTSTNSVDYFQYINADNITSTNGLTVTGSLTVTGGITGSAASASYVEYTNVVNKPTLVSSSAQIVGYNIFATTGSNQFNGSQAVTGSLTVTGQVVAQTLNVQQVTSSIVFSSGSNIFGNSLGNTQQFTGSLQVSGSSHNILGNVGIGPTGTPVSELQVGKSSDVTIAMSNSSSVTSGNRGSLAWYNSSNSTVANIKATAVTDNVGTQLEFYTRPAAGSLTQVLTIGTTGTSFFDTSTSISAAFNSTNASGGYLAFRRSGTNIGYLGNSAQLGQGVLNAFELRADNNLFLTTTSGLLTILSTGNVGIGTASPNELFEVKGTENQGIRLTSTATSGEGANLQWFSMQSGDNKITAEIESDGQSTGGNLFFKTRSTAGVLTDRVIIDNAGNVGIGTGSPSSWTKLQLNGTAGAQTEASQQLHVVAPTTTVGHGAGIRLSAASGAKEAVGIIGIVNEASGNAGAMTFHTYALGANIPERMRITSGGFLKASNNGSYENANGAFHEIISNQGDTNNIKITNTHVSSPYGPWLYHTTNKNNGTNYFLVGEEGLNVRRFALLTNGGLSNYQANDVNLSDERTKKDIEPLESYWDKFKAIEIVKFKYIDQTHDDFNIGVIAQQVESVAPEFVDVDGWGKPELDEEGNTIVNEEEPLKSIYTADLHHATIKVLQECMSKIEEQQSQIESLKAEIQTLKQ
jgi:hypothetical protein